MKPNSYKMKGHYGRNFPRSYRAVLTPTPSEHLPPDPILGKPLTTTQKDRYRILRQVSPLLGWGNLHLTARTEDPRTFPLENAIYT